MLLDLWAGLEPPTPPPAPFAGGGSTGGGGELWERFDFIASPDNERFSFEAEDNAARYWEPPIWEQYEPTPEQEVSEQAEPPKKKRKKRARSAEPPAPRRPRKKRSKALVAPAPRWTRRSAITAVALAVVVIVAGVVSFVKKR